MTQPAAKTPWTVESYFAMEAQSEQKHELWNGAVYAMAGGSPEHNLITANVVALLHALLRSLPCRVY